MVAFSTSWLWIIFKGNGNRTYIQSTELRSYEWLLFCEEGERGSRFSKSASALYAMKFVRAVLKEEGRTGYPFRWYGMLWWCFRYCCRFYYFYFFPSFSHAKKLLCISLSWCSQLEIVLFVLKYNVVLDIRVSSKLPEIAKKNSGYKLLPGSMTVTTIQQQQ